MAWRWSVAAGAAALLAGTLLAACGSTAPHAAPTTTRPSADTPTQSSPASVEPTLEQAIREQNQKKYAPAIADFLSVVKSDPGNEVAWYDLGVIAALHNETAQAAGDYQAALNGDATYVPALFNLAALDAPTSPTTAAQLYQQVIQLQPSNSGAHLNLGFALETLGQTLQAKAQLAEAIRLDPQLASRVPVALGGTAKS